MHSLTCNAVAGKAAITIFRTLSLPLRGGSVSVLWATNKAERLGYCMASESEARREGVLEVLADRSTDAEGLCLT